MSLKPAGWFGQLADKHAHCYPTHKTIGASADVFAEGFRVVRVGDAVAPHGGSCSKHPKTHGAKVWKGSASVFVNGKPMGREGDTVKCDTGQTAPLLRGRPTVVAGDVSPFAKADTMSTVEGDDPPLAKPEAGSTEVAGAAPQVAKPDTGSTEVACDAPEAAGLGTGMRLQDLVREIKTTGGLRSDALPEEIILAPELNWRFQELMRASYPDGWAEERGGLLVTDENGDISVYVNEEAIQTTFGSLTFFEPGCARRHEKHRHLPHPPLRQDHGRIQACLAQPRRHLEFH